MLKYKITIPTASGVTDTHINIPIYMENQMVDQGEIIERKFVSVEVEKSINPIIDYEKIGFQPLNDDTNFFVNKMSYKPQFKISGSTQPVTYGDLGFTDTDVNNRSNVFTKSFLRLSFYDTDNLSKQRLISFITLFPQVELSDYDGGNNKYLGASKTVKFTIGNPKVKDGEVSTYEGFSIFHFADEVTSEISKNLFMKAEFNNAKNGKTTNFMSDSTVVTIDNLVNQLHTQYTLKKTNHGYIYELSGSNVTKNTNEITVNLFEIDSL